MKTFQYVGINKQGKRVSGVLKVNSEQELEHTLAKQEIDLLKAKFKRQKSSPYFTTKVSRAEIISITFQLEHLLRAGVPLLEVLEDLKDSYEKDAIKSMLSTIYESLKGGRLFSEALADYKKVFGNIYIALVKVGEQTGNLETILLNLGQMLKWEDELISKAKKVLIYPAIVSVVVLVVVMLMMLFVVPQLLGFIASMGGELGAATTALIWTSDQVQNYWMELLLTPVVVLLAAKWLRNQSPKFQRKMDYFVLKIPLIGEVLHKLHLARIANAMAVMAHSGIGFTDNLRLARFTAGNHYLQENLAQSIEMIEQGQPIYIAFEQCQVFPSMAVRMVKVGELSGAMAASLENISYFYDREAKERIEKLEPTIEPFLTVVIGGIVGWVMLAVLGPIYDSMILIS